MPTVAPNPIFHPLGPPVVSGTSITVDMMLNQPSRVTAVLRDLTLQRFFVDRVFTNGGGVTGGAVVYDSATDNDLYLTRDIERVAPGSEFPIVTSERFAPKVATPEKWGGKFWFTDEARDRNDAAAFANHVQKLANTIVRKINQRGVETLDAAVAGNGGASNMVGHSWSAAIPNGSNPTAPGSTPAADFAGVQLLADQRELGMDYDMWIVNPAQMMSLRLFYANAAETLAGVLADNGIREIYPTNRVAAGSAYVVATGQVGQMRIESPLATETWRQQDRQRTWVQSSVRPLWFVNNPYAVIKVTGLA